MQKDYDYVFKIVLIGNSSVGKTSLLRRLVDQDFDATNSTSTIGVEFKIITLDLPESHKVAKMQIWDTAGQERYRAITAAYYRGASAIVVVFDITDKKSFDDLPSWLDEVKHHFSEDERCIVYLFGNKKDLEHQRTVGKDEALEFAAKRGMQYREVSAKLGTDVHDSFQRIAKLCEDKYDATLKANSEKEATKIGNTVSVVQPETVDFFDQDRSEEDKKCE